MKKPLKQLLGAARNLESAIAARIEGTARLRSPMSGRQPLEVVHAIVDHVAEEIQPAGRGARAFPFNRIRISIAAATAKARARLEAACDAPSALIDRINERLVQAGCVVRDLDVVIEFVTAPQSDWTQPEFDIECSRAADSAPRPAVVAWIDLAVAHGAAAQMSYRFASAPVAFGRGTEVRDTRQRLIRVNHVAFDDCDDSVNTTVSRQHARIEHDAVPGTFRLFDDASAQGTSVIRHGRGLPVPRGTKGLRLQSGDEIVLGLARVVVTIGRDSGRQF